MYSNTTVPRYEYVVRRYPEILSSIRSTIEWGAKSVRPLLDRFGPDRVISKAYSREQRILHMKVVLHSRLGEPLRRYALT